MKFIVSYELIKNQINNEISDDSIFKVHDEISERLMNSVGQDLANHFIDLAIIISEHTGYIKLVTPGSPIFVLSHNNEDNSTRLFKQYINVMENEFICKVTNNKEIFHELYKAGFKDKTVEIIIC